MKCWVCKRQARGYVNTDVRKPVGDAKRYPIDWVFCSNRCQQAFGALYGNWCRALDGRLTLKESFVIDPSDVEVAAMRQCLKPFGEVAGAIGFDKPLGAYSQEEALQVIDAIVSAYTEAMVQHHETTKFPPVRGMAHTPDPLAAPFADMPDDIPWDDGSTGPKTGKGVHA